MEFTSWKTIAAEAACRALRSGAEIWPLPIEFFSGGRTYTHGLKTRRGTSYVVCREVMQTVDAARLEMQQAAIQNLVADGHQL
jgi:hypothetical protein